MKKNEDFCWQIMKHDFEKIDQATWIKAFIEMSYYGEVRHDTKKKMVEALGFKVESYADKN